MGAPEGTVYLLCTATSALCTILLTRAWLRSRLAMLAWSALCFLLLTLNNLSVFVDLVMLPQTDLGLLRFALSLAAVSVLLYGFVWDT